MAFSNDSEWLDSGDFVYTIHSVIPVEKKQSFELLQHQMNQAACGFDGYCGQSISFQDKDDGQHVLATTRIVFQTLNQCLHWLDSPERRRLLHQAETLMDYRYHGTLEADSFDQWIQARQLEKVPVWKVNLLVWLALYPSVMVLILLGNSTLATLPLPLNMLVSNFITVQLTGHFLVPRLSRLYENWLHTSSTRFTWLGITSVLLVQLFLLTLFSQWPGMPWDASDLSPHGFVLSVVQCVCSWNLG